MSINSLKGNGSFKHSFQDDMESFFYVVLYACVRWLPHNFSGDLAKDMRDFFDDCREKRGMVVGGSLKRDNVIDEYFVECFEWKDDHLANWINVALSFQRSNMNGQDTTMWTAERLDGLWELTDKNIRHKHDRFEHLILVNNEPIKDVPIPATICAMLPDPPACQAACLVKTAPAGTSHIARVSKNKRLVDADDHEKAKRPRHENDCV